MTVYNLYESGIVDHTDFSDTPPTEVFCTHTINRFRVKK